MSQVKRISGREHKASSPGIWLNLVGIAFFSYTLFSLMMMASQTKIIGAVVATALWFLSCYTTKQSFALSDQKYSYLKSSARKLRGISAIFIFLAIFIFAYSNAELHFIAALIIALASAIGSVLYYGWPKDTNLEDLPTGISQHKLVQLSTKAEELIKDLKREVYDVKERSNKNVLRTVIKKTDDLLDTLEKDPKDLYSSRKFINIYLQQSVDITKKLNNAENNKSGNSNNIKYQQTMLAFVEVIDEHHQAIQIADADSLDTQIEVLKQRLESEGI
ncbi:MAG: hypothetical protein GXP14_09740 [Gammaproteobacteria bacterium]|nr:hypothetical protein [Gammaproteobacteria bacterium]